MRMVIDSNALQDDSLRDYLAKSRKNIVVITDYLMIEALKDDPLRKIFGLMKILSEFPRQVIVLAATAEMDAIIANQRTYAEVIEKEAKNYTKDELDILRTDKPYTPQMVDKMAGRIVDLTVKFFETHADKVGPPTALELPYTFMFRLAVCAYLQTLRRIRDGGAQDVKADKIANDIVDATFVAFATYFQGLSSKDAKANELYRNVKHALKGFPVTPDKLAIQPR